LWKRGRGNQADELVHKSWGVVEQPIKDSAGIEDNPLQKRNGVEKEDMFEK